MKYNVDKSEYGIYELLDVEGINFTGFYSIIKTSVISKKLDITIGLKSLQEMIDII